MPTYNKNTKKPSYPEPRNIYGWILIYSIRGSRSNDGHVTILQQGQICVSIHLYGENVEKSISQNVLKTNGWNLQCMT